MQPKSMDEEVHWFDEVRTKGDNIGFAVKRLDTDAIIGGVAIGTFNWRVRHGVFGISIGETSCWGKGYGTDATRVMLRYCFLELNLNRVWLRVFGYNERAIKSYEKCGFSVEGRLREHVYRDGQYWDEIIMGVLRHEWEEQNRAAVE
jgi:RimJ/RimL family protein N-acetyltransferase